LALAAGSWLPVVGCNAPEVHGRERPQRVERTVYLMGTLARFVAEARDREAGLERLERMVRVVEATEAELSTWRDDSVLSGLNRQAIDVRRPVPAATCDLLDRLATWHAATGGTFDPAVGRLVDAWGLRGSGPSPGLASPEAAAGFQHVELDRTACTVARRAPVTLDAGAFGKGEALDRVRRAEPGADGAWLVDFGGQVAVSGPGADGPWPVDVAHPERRAEPAARLRLTGGSIATSGLSGRDLRLDDGSRIGHIFDPRSGRPVARSASVTVWHEQAFVADVLSTALYVMGVDAGLAWAGARGLAAAYLIAGDASGGLRVRATPAFEERFGRLPG
jgi:thiamine biosynthesis lipoprotein